MKPDLITSIKNSFPLSLNKSHHLWLGQNNQRCFAAEQLVFFLKKILIITFFWFKKRTCIFRWGSTSLMNPLRLGFYITFQTVSLKSSFIIRDCVSLNHLRRLQTESKESLFDKGSLVCISGDDRQWFELPIALFFKTVCLSAISAIIECDSR